MSDTSVTDSNRKPATLDGQTRPLLRGENVLIRTSILFLTLAFVASPAFGQNYGPTAPQKGAVAGGIAGAILGGIAGHQNDETPEGIAIGGAVGAIAGGLLGKAKENQVAREYQHQQYHRQQNQILQHQRQQQIKEAVSINDVISLAQTGVGDSLIINQIRSNGVRQKIGVREIISMHQNGVSELVINEMQQRSIHGIAQPAATVAGRSVVVDRPVVVEHRPIVVDQRPVVVASQPRVIVGPHKSYRTPPRGGYYRYR